MNYLSRNILSIPALFYWYGKWFLIYKIVKCEKQKNKNGKTFV